MKKNKNKKGFLFFSFFVYLLLFTLLIVLSFDWIMTFFTSYTSRVNKNMPLINMYTAQDLFIRDIHCAPTVLHKWKKITPTEIIWSCPDHDIGWQFNNKKLLRNEGTYNIKKEKWDKKITSVAAQQLEKVNFFVNKQAIVGMLFIKNVSIEYTLPEKGPIIAVASIQNRVIE